MVRIHQRRAEGFRNKLVSEDKIRFDSNTRVTVLRKILFEVHVLDVLNSENDCHSQVLEAVLWPVGDHLRVIDSLLAAVRRLRLNGCLRSGSVLCSRIT